MDELKLVRSFILFVLLGNAETVRGGLKLEMFLSFAKINFLKSYILTLMGL